MTISAVVPDIAFAGSSGSGTLGPFSLVKSGSPIVFYSNSEVYVYRYDTTTDTAPVLLVEGTDYTLTGGPTAGSITLTSPQTGLLTAERLYVYTQTSIAQSLDLVNGGNFSSANIERRLDIIFQILQQLNREVKSGIRFAMFDTDEIPKTLPLAAAIDRIPYVTGTASAPAVAYLSATTLADLSELSAETLAEIALVAADLAGADTIGIVAAGMDDVEIVSDGMSAVTAVADALDANALPSGITGQFPQENYASLQAAINAAEAAQGGRVLLKGGTTSLSASLVIDWVNVTMEGVGKASALSGATAAVTPVLQVGAASGGPAFDSLLEQFSVTRGVGADAGTVGLQFNEWNNGTVRDLVVHEHGYGVLVLGPTGSVGIQLVFDNLRIYDCRDAYMWIEGAAGVYVTGGSEFGRNGVAESPQPRACVVIRGDANDIRFSNTNIIPRHSGSSTTDCISFENQFNATGYFPFTDFNTEAIRSFIKTDASTPIVNALIVSNSRIACDGSFANQNAATAFKNWSITGSVISATDFTATFAQWNRIESFIGCNVAITLASEADLHFSSRVVGNATFTGGGADSHLDLTGSIITGNLTIAGTLGSYKPPALVLGTTTVTATIVSQAAKHGWINYTPTVTSGSGTITSYTINRARYRYGEDGRVHVDCSITITDPGTAGGGLRVTHPVATASSVAAGAGRQVGGGGKALAVQFNSADTYMLIHAYDNSTAIASGATIVFELAYEPT